MDNVAAIVLAAGAGTRLKSKKPKVAHDILGKPLVRWVIDAAKDAGINTIVSVVGHGEEYVRPLVEADTEAVLQPERRGTADAVLCGLSATSLKDFNGYVVILSGDCPLIESETISGLLAYALAHDAGAVVLTMDIEDPFGYGRVVRSSDGEVEKIVEQKDATIEEAALTECNSGFYCFDAHALKEALSQIDSNNAQGEFYLTDAIEIIKAQGKRVFAYESETPEECLGVNSRLQLAEATAIKQMQINCALMDSGVTMIAPDLVWCGADVHVAPDVTIYPNVTLMGTTTIDEDTTILPNTLIKDSHVGTSCVVGPNTRLFDTKVSSACTIDETVSYEAELEDEVTCGPRAYLRPLTHMCKGSKAGTHVEIKKSTIGPHSKVPHLSYIGDTTMGEGVNVGAGSITCNYDGVHKHATHIGNNTFIGSDTMMVAPVTIGDNALIGAGSVITKDIPTDALAVARSREKIYEGWTETHKK